MGLLLDLRKVRFIIVEFAVVSAPWFHAVCDEPHVALLRSVDTDQFKHCCLEGRSFCFAPVDQMSPDCRLLLMKLKW